MELQLQFAFAAFVWRIRIACTSNGRSILAKFVRHNHSQAHRWLVHVKDPVHVSIARYLICPLASRLPCQLKIVHYSHCAILCLGIRGAAADGFACLLFVYGRVPGTLPENTIVQTNEKQHGKHLKRLLCTARCKVESYLEFSIQSIIMFYCCYCYYVICILLLLFKLILFLLIDKYL